MGPPIRRGVYGAPASGIGGDHPIGSRFASIPTTRRTGPASNAAGLFVWRFNPIYVGVLLYFKFQAYNQFGNGAGLHPLISLPAYTFTPTGTAVGQSHPHVVSPGSSLAQSGTTTITMPQAEVNFPNHVGVVNYNARSFTIATPTSPYTIYYVTIYDPSLTGDTGSATTLTAYCEAVADRVGQPGYTYIGAIQATPSGSGAVTLAGGWPLPAPLPT
jgi:hypothetical protein